MYLIDLKCVIFYGCKCVIQYVFDFFLPFCLKLNQKKKLVWKSDERHFEALNSFQFHVPEGEEFFILADGFLELLGVMGLLTMNVSKLFWYFNSPTPFSPCVSFLNLHQKFKVLNQPSPSLIITMRYHLWLSVNKNTVKTLKCRNLRGFTVFAHRSQ